MNTAFQVHPMRLEDVGGVAELQPLAFPPPFPSDLHWAAEDLASHLKTFPQGQWVVVAGERVVGSCSNTRISEGGWQAHASWSVTVGGPCLNTFDSTGSTLYGLDLSVHPDFRRLGIGRALYLARFDLVRSLGLIRYGTACRMPGCADYMVENPDGSPDQYAREVLAGRLVDRTLAPLLRYGLRLIDVVHGYMRDAESLDSAALLEWTR